MVLKYPEKAAVKFEVINQEIAENWKVEAFNRNRDTLQVWLRDVNLDSLQVQVLVADTILDTTMIVYRKPKIEKKKRKNDDEVTVERIKIGSNAKNRSIDLGKNLQLEFDDPLSSYDFSRTRFISGSDTSMNPGFTPTDSSLRRFVFDMKITEETNYEFLFPDSSFYSIYGFTNDSTFLKFKSKAAKDYGNIIVDAGFTENGHPYIIQLLTLKEVVLMEKFVTESSLVIFDNIIPGKYLLKAIGDKWPNNRWDSGNYFKKRQPENVLFFPAEIEVRANWDIEKSWSLP
jgi:hypothetical protein